MGSRCKLLFVLVLSLLEAPASSAETASGCYHVVNVDALNVFDGARIGTYEDGYYRYLNIGIRLPISTGTDWFLYDLARVYAKVPV